MGDKDVAERGLEELDDVYADIVNALLFDGEQVVTEGDLADASPRSGYASEGRPRGLERDVCKYLLGPGGEEGAVRLALVALENQSEPDPAMALRVIGYDGASYRAQLARRGKGEKEGEGDDGGGPAGEGDAAPAPARYHPVVTLVLNFGPKRWPGPFRLSDCLEVPGRLRRWLSDYELHVVDVAFLSDEEVARFRGDFGAVADYLAGSRRDPGYVPPARPLDHPDETVALLSALGGEPCARAYREMLESGADKKEVTMWDLGQGLIEKGREQGVEQGIEKGRRLGIEQGIEQGETLLGSLVSLLLQRGDTEAAARAASDPEYRRELYAEYGIA